MKLKIYKKTLQISCFRVLPGTELQVAAHLKTHCEQLKVENYIILKTFGAFDIVAVYEATDFIDQIIQHKPISCIVKSIHLPCFSYRYRNISNDFYKIFSKKYMGISLLKLNGAIGEEHRILKNRIIQDVRKRQNADGVLLGTFGWNELALLSAANDPKSIIESVFWANDRNDDKAVIKSSTILGMKIELFQNASGKYEPHELENNMLSNSELNEPIAKNIMPTLYITSLPQYSKNIKQYWSGICTVLDTVGRDDLCVEIDYKIKPEDRITWAKYISKLMQFRYEFRNVIISTQVKFNVSMKDNNYEIPCLPEESHSPELIEYDKEIYETRLGRSASHRVIIVLNFLNDLFQSKLYSTAFLDMYNYALWLNQLITGDDDYPDLPQIAIRSAIALKAGAEARLYGAYGHLDESFHQSATPKGAIQRVLLAIEAIPKKVLKDRMDAMWEGFVVTTENVFATHTEIIFVPHDVLFTPERWWALYHEIGHVYINNSDFVNESIQPIKLFLSDREQPDWWLKMLNEIFAEIIGYHLGFYGDFDFFISVVWQYLELEVKGDKQNFYDQYVPRTYFVWLYDELFNKKVINKNFFNDKDGIYLSIINHITKIEKVLNSYDGNGMPDKYYIAAKTVRTVMDSYNILEYFNNKISEFIALPSISELSHTNTIDVVKYIKSGAVWFDDIIYPEAVMYKISKNMKMTPDNQVALILSLWNLHRITPNLEVV